MHLPERRRVAGLQFDAGDYRSGWERERRRQIAKPAQTESRKCRVISRVPIVGRLSSNERRRRHGMNGARRRAERPRRGVSGLGLTPTSLSARPRRHSEQHDDEQKTDPHACEMSAHGVPPVLDVCLSAPPSPASGVEPRSEGLRLGRRCPVPLAQHREAEGGEQREAAGGVVGHVGRASRILSTQVAAGRHRRCLARPRRSRPSHCRLVARDARRIGHEFRLCRPLTDFRWTKELPLT